MTQLTTVQPNSAPAVQTREVADLAAKYRNALEKSPTGFFSISLERAPASADREALEARARELEGSLLRGDPRAMAQRVARMFLRYRSSGMNDTNSEAVVAAYVSDLQKFPLWAIDKAIIAAIDKGSAFAPSGPELRAACDRIVSDIRAEIADLRHILDAAVYTPETPEQRARVKAEFEKLVQELGMRESPRREAVEPRLSTQDEAKGWLERYQLNPPPVPVLSDQLRTKLGLQPEKREEDAA